MRTFKTRPVQNSTFAIGRVSCSADSFVVAESFVFRINICAERSRIANLQIVSSNPIRPSINCLENKPTSHLRHLVLPSSWLTLLKTKKPVPFFLEAKFCFRTTAQKANFTN
jgi:hypothetical protein